MKTDKDTYKLPLIKKFHSSKKELFVLITVLSIFLFISLYEVKDIYLTALIIIFIILILFSYVFLRPRQIEITDRFIKVTSKARVKITHWEDVVDLELISTGDKLIKGFYTIGVITKKNMVNEEFPLVVRIIISLFKPTYGLSIPLKNLKGIDSDKLFFTMQNKIKVEIEEDTDIDKALDELSETKDFDKYPFRAYIYIVIIGIFTGVLQGYLLYISSITRILLVFYITYFIALFLPISATYLMIILFHSLYSEKRFGFINRLIFAFAILILFSLGPINKFYFHIGKIPTIKELPQVSFIVINRYLSNIDEFSSFNVIIGIVSLYMGITHGYSSKMIVKIKKWLFRLKSNKYYYTKEDDMYNVYIVEPEKVSELYDELFQLKINEGLLIEKGEKRPLSFYIPTDIIKEVQIKFSRNSIITIKNKEYFYIDFKDRTKRNPKPYLLPCSLQFDRKKEIKIVRFRYLK
ncbi:MAG: hypothetical protein FH751_13930 [Firmicutes bacterium]|nr:hypothetical protein [Bacillota bacterium]